jgi:hypothetical protein
VLTIFLVVVAFWIGTLCGLNYGSVQAAWRGLIAKVKQIFRDSDF